MKNILRLFFVLLLIGCNNKVEVKIIGYVYNNIKQPVESINIETRVVLNPMKSIYSKRTDVIFKQNGKFEFKIKRNKMKGDDNFAVLITKKGYKDEYRFIDIRENEEIHLDTVFLKLKK